MFQLFQQLGVNETFFIQFVLYIFIFTFLSLFVFGPYVEAKNKREERTKGTELIAEELRHKYNEVNSDYQLKAKEVHNHIQEIFQAVRKEAAQEYDRIVGQAKAKAQALIEQNNAAIAKAVDTANAELRGQSQAISADIVKKVLGK